MPHGGGLRFLTLKSFRLARGSRKERRRAALFSVLVLAVFVALYLLRYRLNF
jgi:hypothetical protein